MTTFKPKRDAIQMRVLITPKNDYLRYEGKRMTNHIISTAPLLARDVDFFRRYPDSFIRTHIGEPPDEPPPDLPYAA